MNTILKLRKARGWSQQDCCDRAKRRRGKKVFQQQWARWQAIDDLSRLQHRNLVLVAKVFSLTVDDLLAGGAS